MPPVSRCRVPVDGRRGPASNLSVPVSRCSVLVSLCRALLLACRLLVFPSCFFFSFRACRVSPQVRWMAPVSRCRVPVDGRRGSLPILVCLFPVAGCLLPCVGLFFLLAGCLFFRPVLFSSFRACRVSPQARWMALVSRCRVPVYGRRGPASNLSVPVSRCGVPAALCRAPFLAFRLLVFPSWIYFLVSGVPRLAASPLDASRFALQGARLRPQGSCFQS